MIHDALRNMEEKGTVPDETWTKELKEAAATAFLGMCFTLGSIFTHPHSYSTFTLAASETVRRYDIVMNILMELCRKNSLTRSY